MLGKPLQRAAQITNDDAVALAVDALLYGSDEDPDRIRQHAGGIPPLWRRR